MIYEELSKIEDKEVAALVEKETLERIERIIKAQGVRSTNIDWSDPYIIDKWYAKVGFYGILFDKFSRGASAIGNPPEVSSLPDLPSNPVRNIPELTKDHVSSNGKRWDYPALIDAAEAANPGERYTRKDVGDMKKPRIAELLNPLEELNATPIQLELLNKETLITWAENPRVTGDEGMDTLLSILVSKCKTRLTKGATEYLELEQYVPADKPLELPVPRKEKPTPEVLATLASQLEPRHFLKDKGYISRVIITAELYKATRVVYDLSKLPTSAFQRPS